MHGSQPTHRPVGISEPLAMIRFTVHFKVDVAWVVLLILFAIDYFW
jgi:hypothetical protein